MMRYLAPKMEKFKLLLTLDLCYLVTMSDIKNLNICDESLWSVVFKTT